jgi:hypothetical protein
VTVAAQNLAKRLADLVGASKLSHDDKQLALIAVISALGNPK